MMGLFGLVEDGKARHQPATMRLDGWLMGATMRVLVDSSSSHNIIEPQIVLALKLPVEQHRAIGVKFGNGHRAFTTRKCTLLELHLGQFTTLVDAYVLDMGDLDMILGAAWMKKFGKVTFDWEAMALSFSWNGKTMEVKNLNTVNEKGNAEN